MQLGDLKKLVRIEKPTLTADSNGQEIETWSTLADVWARVTYLQGNEGTEAEQRVALRKVQFTIRYRGDIVETYRILYESKYYGIIGIERSDRKKYLNINAVYADRGT